MFFFSKKQKEAAQSQAVAACVEAQPRAILTEDFVQISGGALVKSIAANL